MIELLALSIFLLALAIGGAISSFEDRRRTAEAATEAARPSINWALQDARRKGFPY